MANIKIVKIPYDKLIHIGIWDNYSKRQKLSSIYSELVKKYPNKEIYIMNAGFFNGDFTSALALKAAGIVIDNRWTYEAFYAFNGNSKPELYSKGYTCPIHKKDAVAVHPPLLEKGVKSPDFRYCIDNSNRGRSLIGHNDNYFVMVCVSDATGSSDFTLDESIKYMQQLGCTYAGNLDGGRSSQCNFNGKTINSSRLVNNFIYSIVEPDEDSNNKLSTEEQYQTWLNQTYRLGLAVDGSLGPASNKGQIKAMQTENGSDVDGSWGPASKAEHKSFTKGSKYATVNRVKILQGALCRKGFWSGDINGVFDDDLLTALKSYQSVATIVVNGKVTKLVVDGWAGSATFTSLFSY